KTSKTYNTRYSLVVTDPTTNPALIGLSMGERTGSRVFQWVWSYVMVDDREAVDIGSCKLWKLDVAALLAARCRLSCRQTITPSNEPYTSKRSC
ncbi:uncharacterized protein BDZ83DRAFT_583174, partial [Colletotrichum acutatum]